MFSLRNAALRVLTSRTSTIVARPRTFTSITYSSQKPIRATPSIHFQRRWASNEAEAKQEEVPVSQLQPTPEEEIENASHENGAAIEADHSKPVMAETANATEATEDVTTSAAESESVAQPIDTTFNSSERRTTSGSRGPLRDPPSPKSTIYVGNLFFDVTENDLKKEFGSYGTIKNARIIKDARGLSKGFGYIQFESTEIATQAVEEKNQQIFEGRRLLVSYATTEEPDRSRTKPRDEGPVNPPSKTLFIGNMSFEMTDKDLNQLFRGIRNVIDVRVAIDRRTGQPRGFAHADFVDTKSAMDAMKILATKENYGRKLRLDYSYGPSTAPRNTPR